MVLWFPNAGGTEVCSRRFMGMGVPHIADALLSTAAHRIAHLFPLPSAPDTEGSSASCPRSPPERPYPTPTRGYNAEHPPGPSEQSLQPGESIPIYDKHDFTGAFPHAYELVLNVAARWAGVSAENVALVVTGFDRALIGKSRADIFATRERSIAEESSEPGHIGGVGDIGEGEQGDDGSITSDNLSE